MAMLGVVQQARLPYNAWMRNIHLAFTIGHRVGAVAQPKFRLIRQSGSCLCTVFPLLRVKRGRVYPPPLLDFQRLEA